MYEITGSKILLENMDLEGTTVRGDAMMCQTSIAEIIIRKGGDYCFTVKSNQPTLLKDIKDYFESDPKCETCTTVGKGQTFSKRECIERRHKVA